MRYDWIHEHQVTYPVTTMCRILDVSTTGYYDARGREPSKQARRQSRIHDAVQSVYAESQGIYGSWKITEILQQRDELESACRNTVAKAMRELGLKSRVCKAFKPTTTQSDPSKKPAANLLNQDFEADASNRKWVTDITYLPTERGWAYLAVVMDLFGRKVVGWSIGDSLATDLVSDALRNAIENRRPTPAPRKPDGAGSDTELLHHSDRGCQYTSDAYQKTLRTLGITCSMSRTGCCYDNAAMERFFWSLKHEWTKHEHYADLDHARLSVFKYIDLFYNPKRIHQALGYKTPDQYEAENAPAKKVA